MVFSYILCLTNTLTFFIVYIRLLNFLFRLIASKLSVFSYFFKNIVMLIILKIFIISFYCFKRVIYIRLLHLWLLLFQKNNVLTYLNLKCKPIFLTNSKICILIRILSIRSILSNLNMFSEKFINSLTSC
ncbi:hypothetical protein EDEG_02771 [Edhazardia aedis USNM 41457]|uniref:Transmembrane protein n=1 Tax=Edhazardia aedis (strain USNM 41457) TaxID=1003232 RepID=J9DJM9_EDHAE|nr:hypothetical protein EDEG_02771 [Edhazardia aedis USNM 41457]|eukprot:EJW02830.1 hypothetical protein EDEG_02771 [Edhazardia aedis USNM 41457]